MIAMEAASRQCAQVRFADGSQIELRPLGIRDGRLISNFVDQLSPETSYRRFLTSGRGVRSNWVAGLINADQRDYLVFGAVAVDQFGSTLVAVAESIRDPEDEHLAEFALAAADPWQNLGIGTLLMRQLARVALSSGVLSWETYTMAGNDRIESVMDHVGVRVSHRVEMGLAHSVYRISV